MTDKVKDTPRMQFNTTLLSDPAQIREQAERKIKTIQQPEFSSMTSEEIQQLFHELQIKHIEAGLQNEQLCSQLEERDDQAAMFRIVNENMLDMVALTDVEGNFTFVGKSHEILGYDPDFLFGKNVMDFVHPEDFQNIMNEFSGFVASKHSRRVEYRYRCEDGTYLWLETVGNFITNKKGIPQKIIFTSRNITERKQVEESARKTEGILKDIFETTLSGFWDWNLVDNTEYLSPTFKRMFGYEDHEMESSPEAWQRIIFPEDLPGVLAVFDQHVKSLGQEAFYNEVRYRHRDGSTVWVICAGRVIEWTQDGAPIRMVGCHFDITERKNAERNLRESEARYRELVENTNSIILRMDMTGRISFFNNFAQSFFGYKATEIIGRNVIGAIVPERDFSGKDLRAMIADIGQNPERYVKNENENMKKDGTRVWVSWSNKPILDSVGKVREILCVGNDITERKQAETYREIGREILQILNEPGDLQESIQRVLATLKTRTGVDAVGLRLQEGEDFPYFAQDGFSKDFLRTENTLVERGSDGGVCRDKDGNVRLECTCGLVISGKTDPSDPLFTQGGSSWTNDSFPLLDLPPDQDPRLHPRNNCIHQGYASVALIPIKHDTAGEEVSSQQGYASVALIPVRTIDRIVGLIQLNDKRKGRFTLETIEILEGIAAHIGSFLMRKQAEEALKESEASLQSVLNSTADGILAVGKNNKVLYVNERFSELWRIPSGIFEIADDSILLQYILDQLSDPEGFLQKVQELYNSDKESFDVINFNDVRVFERLSRPLLSGSEVMGRVWSFRDITERKRVEAERERLITAIEQGDDVVIITDADGLIQYVNPAFETVTGYTREEARGQNPRILKSGNHDESFYRNMWDTLIGGNTFHGRMINKRKDGSQYTEDVTISPVRDLAGNIVNYVGVKRDVTAHIQLENQFAQAQKMESVGRLAGGVAHDFNNKLMIISGYTEMAIDTMDPSDPLLETIQEIHTAVQQSAEIVRQLLAFARKQTIHPVELDLNDTISSMLKMLQRLIGENIDLTWHLGNNLPPVKIDPSQVDQIMANLAVNARDAISDVGKMTIETKNTVVDEEYCKSNPEANPGRYVMLAVSDDGCGMEKEIIELIFEPFFTTKEVGKGTGLGLPTIYGIVKQNNGFMNVYSEPGKGSTFKIYLPAFEASITTLPLQNETTRQVPVGTETILMVEDEATILKLSAKSLTQLGYTVMTAENPSDALKLAKEYGGTIHLLITDVVMPEMNGLDLSTLLLKDYPHLKILFMSGYPADVIADHGVLDEGVQFIQKPFSLKDLAAKVREAIE